MMGKQYPIMALPVHMVAFAHPAIGLPVTLISLFVSKDLYVIVPFLVSVATWVKLDPLMSVLYTIIMTGFAAMFFIFLSLPQPDILQAAMIGAMVGWIVSNVMMLVVYAKTPKTD